MNTGWAVNKQYVYRTVDSGVTWQRFPIEFIEDGAKVSHIAFADSLTGWIVLEQYKEGGGFSKDDKISIYRTLDGGETWGLSKREISTTAPLLYINANTVWITVYGWVNFICTQVD